MRILFLDHRDSFVWNLVQDLGSLAGTWPEVVDALDGPRDEMLERVLAARRQPDLIVLGPGPGHPEDVQDAGAAPEIVLSALGRIPLFGVCLGMQILATATGARVARAPAVIHGKSPDLVHRGEGILRGLPSPTPMMRYHSWVVDRASLSAEWRVTGESEDGLVMALEHRTAPAFGVQFHPESVGSPAGRSVLENVIRRIEGGSREASRRAGEPQSG